MTSNITHNNLQRREDLHREIALLKERLNIALEAGNLAWWEMDVPSGGVLCNDQKFTMLGYDRNEFPNQIHYTHFTNLLHPDFFEPTMNAMRDHLAGKKELYECEYKIQTKSGGYRWFYDRGSITDRDEQGNPITVKGIVFDNTERREAEEQLRESNRAKDMLFSVISHDLRSSVGNLVMILDLLNDDSMQDETADQSGLLTKLHSSSKTTMNLLENLLHWAGSQINAITSKRESFVIEQILAEEIERQKPVALEKEICLKCSGNTHATVLCDKSMFQIIMRNLLSNAIKFSLPNSTVSVEVSKRENKIALAVSDQGKGIDDEILPLIFTLNADKKRRGTAGEKSVGLGLMVVQEFVQANQGTVTVENLDSGGACFTVTLDCEN